MSAALLLAMLLAPGSRAELVLEGDGPLGGSTLRVDERFVLRYYQLDDRLPGFEDLHVLDYVEEVDRLNLLVSGSGYALGAQLDQVGLFANRYILDGTLYHERALYDPGIRSPWDDAYLGLEKLYYRRQGRVVEVQLGDAYVSFGRGLALNLVRNTDIDVDSSLRGLRTVLRLGDWDVTAATGLTNPQQVQQYNRNLGIHPDLRHMITGLRVERFGLGPANLGAHGVLYRFARGYDPSPEEALERYGEPLDAVVLGGTAEAYGVGGADLLFEGDWFDYRSRDFFEGEEPRPGYGLYGSASLYPGRFVVLLEGKRYKDTERINAFTMGDGYEVAVPPTLEYERVITEDSSATVNSNDVAGVRLRVDYAARPGVLIPYLSLALFRDRDTGALHFNRAPETVLHPVGGVQWLGTQSRLLANAGLRQDFRDDDTGRDLLAHADVDVLLPAGGPATLELGSAFKRFLWGENPVQQADYTELENTLALHWGEHWSYLLYQDYSDNPLIDSRGNLSEHLYAAGELQYKPGTATTLKLFYGAYKAGIRCAGGQCRNLPGFRGFRFTLEGTF